MHLFILMSQMFNVNLFTPRIKTALFNELRFAPCPSKRDTASVAKFGIFPFSITVSI